MHHVASTARANHILDMYEMNDLDRLPFRVKFYLMEWMDSNIDQFEKQFGTSSLRELNTLQLYTLFDNIVRDDLGRIQDFLNVQSAKSPVKIETN